MNERKNWPNLPRELIHEVTGRFLDVADFVRFRAVCKGWRSSAPLSDPPPQMPWLLQCLRAYPPETPLRKKLLFYSLASHEIGAIHVKRSHRGKSFHGPCSGYLMLLSQSMGRMSMWNPLTNAVISLPSFQVASHWPVWTGSDPILSRNIVLVDRCPHLANKMGSWAIYHPGDAKWTVKRGYFYNSCYWDGKFFTTKGWRDTKVFDVMGQKLLYTIPSPDQTGGIRPQSYLVEMSGVIMRVSMYLGWIEDVEEAIFHFYQLSFKGGNQNPSWVKVTDIGDHILFLDLKNGFSMKPVAGFKGNCIYFLSRRSNTPCRYDIAANTFQRVPCPFEDCTWFFPSLG